MFRSIVLTLSVCLALPVHAETGGAYDIDTYLALKRASSISVSPDGAFVAWTESGNDLEADRSASAVWMQPTAGGVPVRMTAAGIDAWSPKWSPDDRYLAFLSDRKDGRTQVWLLDRRGGDARQLTGFRQGVQRFEWSPDGSRILLLARDPSPADLDEEERPNPRPWVIDRLQFKRDYVGYLDRRRTHVYLVDLASRETRQLTHGDFDDSQPAWSPDGRHIVFVSNRTASPDQNRNTDIWRIDTRRNDSRPERLTDTVHADASPVYSPDGRTIAYLTSASDGLPVYAIPQLAILELETGRSRLVESLAETQVLQHRFTGDGASLLAIIEYRGEQQLVEVDPRTGATRRLISGEDTVLEFDIGPGNRIYALVSRPQSPAEIFVLAEDGLQPFSNLNGGRMAGITTATVEKHTFTSRDGTAIDTFVVFPPGFEKGRRYPGVLHIHGGPWAQWDWRFDHESQLFAAQGYVVVMPNFRGSWGYGQAFTDALVGKWGDIDYADSMDAMDFAIEQGWVDADRMATYGWSWGGYLTNHVITKTDRFKAAISGAGETLMMVNYGHDEWQRLWHEELGSPWLEENRHNWDRVSPFFSLDKVTTPTLVVCGENDWNMPVINSEQLYIVLKRRGIPTELIVYPGQHHGISVPSYQRDLYERYLAWLDRFLVR